MSRHRDGGPAFPGPWENPGDLNATAPDGQLCPPGCTVHMQGMTLRDFYAAEAMKGILGSGAVFAQAMLDPTVIAAYRAGEYEPIGDQLTRAAFAWADRMIEARSR